MVSFHSIMLGPIQTYLSVYYMILQHPSWRTLWVVGDRKEHSLSWAHLISINNDLMNPSQRWDPCLMLEDPSLNGKRNFCYCLSTELIQLSISSVVGYFLNACLLITSIDSTCREIGITCTPVTCTCIVQETNILSLDMLRLMYAHKTVICKGCQFIKTSI